MKKYAVLGHPIGHTMSPFIHRRLFELSGINAQYSTIDIDPLNFERDYKILRELDGYNITIPYKQKIIDLIDELSPKALMYGSVNTVSNTSVAKGYTTDPMGFLKALSAENIGLKGKVVILGTGGVARTMAFEAVLAEARLTIAVRPSDMEYAELLKKELNDKVKGSQVQVTTIDKLKGNIDLLVNATPVGMYPHCDDVAVNDKIINSSAAVFDAVYNPLETVLIKKALANGARAVGGMSMLVWQAVEAHTIWDGSTYNISDINSLCMDCSKELKKVFG